MGHGGDVQGLVHVGELAARKPEADDLLGVVQSCAQDVGLFGAGTLVDLLEVGLFEQRVSPASIALADRLLPFPHEHVVEEVPFTLSPAEIS